jgi:hypothetical protein
MKSLLSIFFIISVIYPNLCFGQRFPFDTSKYFAYYKIQDQIGKKLQSYRPYIFLANKKCLATNSNNIDSKQAISFWPVTGDIRHECWVSYSEIVNVCPVGKEKTGAMGNACINIQNDRFLDTNNLPRLASFDEGTKKHVSSENLNKNNFSFWEFFEDKTTADTPVCGIFSGNTDKTNVRNVSVKNLENREVITITLYNDQWNFKQGSNVNVIIDFADNQPLKLSAYGDGKVLDFSVPKQLTSTFLSLMRDSKLIRFIVGNGAKPWSVPLHNIGPPLQQFVDCSLAMIQK